MRILFLEPLQTLIFDVVAWVILHLGIGYGSTKIPLKWLNPDRRFFQAFAWEKNGRIYDQLFRVHSWKRFIPNGSALYRGAFSIKKLPIYDLAYLHRWLKESVRSEICHWIMILPGFFFFLWNDVVMGWVMVAYAFLNNLVPIIMQRYNRPRVRKLLAQLERKNLQKGEFPVIYAPQQAFSHSYE